MWQDLNQEPMGHKSGDLTTEPRWMTDIESLYKKSCGFFIRAQNILPYVPQYRQLFNETQIPGTPGQLLELLGVFKNVGVCDINIKLAKEKWKGNYTVHQALLYSTKNCLMGELAGCYAATYNY